MPICDACLSEFPARGGYACARCGDSIDIPLSSAPEANLCRVCRLAPPPFVRAVAYGPYEGRMRDAIHVLKYSRMHAAARFLGPMLAAAIDRLANEAPAEMLVVPVPLYRSKRAARGFNQARLLAIHAIQALRKTNRYWRLTLAPRALMRVRATRSQAGLTTRQRRQNLRGAFRVSDTSAVAGRHILVIDDIFTTGATARAAARALVSAGAAGVWVATLARAGRLYSNSRNSSADLDLAQMRRGTPGGTLAGNSQIARMHSSTDQPSF